MTNTWNIRFFKLPEDATVKKALNWVKECHVDFERMSGSVDIGKGSHIGLAACLNYANGYDCSGKKIRKNSNADWERRRFANQRVAYYEISIAPDGMTCYTLLDEYAYNRSRKLLKDRPDIKIEISDASNSF